MFPAGFVLWLSGCTCKSIYLYDIRIILLDFLLNYYDKLEECVNNRNALRMRVYSLPCLLTLLYVAIIDAILVFAGFQYKMFAAIEQQNICLRQMHTMLEKLINSTSATQPMPALIIESPCSTLAELLALEETIKCAKQRDSLVRSGLELL